MVEGQTQEDDHGDHPRMQDEVHYFESSHREASDQHPGERIDHRLWQIGYSAWQIWPRHSDQKP